MFVSKVFALERCLYWRCVREVSVLESCIKMMSLLEGLSRGMPLESCYYQRDAIMYYKDVSIGEVSVVESFQH